MRPAQPARRPVVISSLDLPGGRELLLHGCEDCACPVSDDQRLEDEKAPPVAGASGRWVCGGEVIEIPLDADHRLLFNPVARGSGVVVNHDAYRIFRCFQRPAALAGVQAAWPGRADEVAETCARLSRAGMIHPAGQPQNPEFLDGEVLTAWLHVTNACNLRCPYCYVNKSAEGMDESTGRAAVDAVVESAVTHGFPAVKLKYAGGEASLNHRLVASLHAYARELAAARGLRLYATLLSNGVTLPPAFVETLKAGGIRVMISLDGLGDQHDAQRPFASGKPSFHRVERTIAQLVEQDHAPHLSVTITNRNAGGVADVVRFALERNLTFSLNFFRDNDCAASFPDLRYEEQVMISALLDAFGVIEEFLPPWSVLGSVLDRGQLLQPRQRSCGVGQDYVVIDQRGRVAKCHMEIEKTLGDVFSDDPLRLVRRDNTTALNLAVEEKEGCRGCTWRYWCSGGCTVATFRATGRYDIKSPNCHIYQAIYPQALRLEGLRLLKYATT
ncbi:MAG TPA: radical SAM protein [Streptosporangiaceae bacterium]|nr:radical SAM protein [Streptosporangiaceae bacterium]